MKKFKLIIIILITILVLLCGTLGYLYFATDILKSNKRMFNKYASQIDLKDFLELKDYEEFAEKISKESHTNKGKITIKANVEEETREEISFETKNNKEENSASGEINYSQGENNNLKIGYLKNDDLYGLKCIYRQYMAIESEKLPEFADRMGIDLEEINKNLNGLEVAKSQTTDETEYETSKIEETIKSMSEKYINMLIEKIPEKNYEKINKQQIEIDGKNIEVDGYRIVLTQTDLINLFEELLNTAKNDSEMFNLFKLILEKSEQQDLTFEQYQDFIEEINEDFSKDIIKDDNVKISINMYKQGKKLVKASFVIEEFYDESNLEVMEFSIENNKKIKFSNIMERDNTSYFDEDEYTISSRRNKETYVAFEKNTTSGENIYNLEYGIKDEEMEMKMNAAFLLKNIGQQNYEMKFDLGLNLDIDSTKQYFEINFANTTSFEDDIEVEKFEEGNYILLNNLTDEQLLRIRDDFGNKLSEKIDFDKMFIGNFGMNASLFNNASEARNQTKIAEVLEAMALTKADILADFYSQEDNTTYTIPTTKQIMDSINSYLPEGDLKVKEPEEPITDESGTTWIIEIDDETGRLKLDNTKNKLTINFKR